MSFLMINMAAEMISNDRKYVIYSKVNKKIVSYFKKIKAISDIWLHVKMSIVHD